VNPVVNRVVLLTSAVVVLLLAGVQHTGARTQQGLSARGTNSADGLAHGGSASLESVAPHPSGAVPLPGALGHATSEELQARRAMWMDVALNPDYFPCAAAIPGGFPVKKNCIPGREIKPAGDSVLFNALLCYSGEERGCEGVRRSQDGLGRWWRSPLHVGQTSLPDGGKRQTTFSKDHVDGALLYLAVKEKSNAASNWLSWMQNENTRGTIAWRYTEQIWQDLKREGIQLGECIGDGLPCISYQVFGRWEDLSRQEKIACGLILVAFPPLGVVCPALVQNAKKWVETGRLPEWIHLPVMYACPDSLDCFLTPNIYAMMYSVWRHIGLKPTLNMQVFKFERSLTEHDHLNATGALVDKVSGRELRATHEAINRAIDDSPDNPFYQYMAGIDGDAQYDAPLVARTTLQHCYLTREQYEYPKGDKWKGSQWSWERDDLGTSTTDDSMAWDCVFMANLLLGPPKAHEDIDHCYDVDISILRDVSMRSRELRGVLPEEKKCYTARSSITTKGTVVLKGDGDVTLRAGSEIVLGPGFAANKGVAFHAAVNPALR
jgi:hypothetical protein